jgi:hypothetical protein
MFRVRWAQAALDELATLWIQAGSGLRLSITAATAEVDWKLRTDPWGSSESRPGGRRVLFVSPLGITFRIEPDGQTVSVLRVWLFRHRAK